MLSVEASPASGELERRAAFFAHSMRAELGKAFEQRAVLNIRQMSDSLRSGSFATNVGMREGIAAGLRSEKVTTTTSVGVRILATADHMPPGREAMVAAWQCQSWQHPVFGNTDVTVSQQGRPYFVQVDADRRTTTTETLHALERAANVLGGRA